MATSRSINAPVVPGALFFFRDEKRELARPRCRAVLRGSATTTAGTTQALPTRAPSSAAIASLAAANSKSLSVMPPASWVDSESVTRL